MRVACLVAVPVVDLFEAVQVEEEHRESGPAGRGVGQPLPQLAEEPAVGQTHTGPAAAGADGFPALPAFTLRTHPEPFILDRTGGGHDDDR